MSNRNSPAPTDPHGAHVPPSPWVTRFAALVPKDGKVLDLAAGGGRHGRFFLNSGYPVVFLDKNTEKLNDLSEHPGAHVLAYDLEDGSPWPFAPQEFDAIAVANYLHRPLFDHFGPARKPGGLLLYETFVVGNEAFGKPSNPNFLLEKDELLGFGVRGFTLIAFEQGKERGPDGPRMGQRLAARKSDEMGELP